MKYFKNTELAKLYNVSEKSVRNWIQAAQEGKIDLQLYEQSGKFWVANTSKNTVAIENLVQKGKKFKNRRGLKAVTPVDEFYKLYNHKQILDIISNLTIHHEIPTQYSYFDGGAKYWDEYTHRLSSEQAPNILKGTVELLDATFENVDKLIDNYERVNVVDLGPGNGLPIRSTLERLLKEGKLNRYIAIDCSKEMLEILEQNINTWFEGKVKFEGHIRDISYERFDDLLAGAYTENVINLVFLLGNTLNNFRSPDQVLTAISNSLGLNDLLFYSCYLDTPTTRRYFDFNSSRQNQKFRSELILDLLNIGGSLYGIEQKFNEEKRARSICMIPTVDLSIAFSLQDGVRTVELRKNEPILLWRGRHKDTVETINQFDENGLDLVQATKTKDQQYLLTTSRIKVESEF